MPLKSSSGREVVPFASVEALVRALDLGERILGIRFGAGDMEISVGEAKDATRRARHDVSLERTMSLFMAMLMSELSANDAARAISHFSSGLMTRVREHYPSTLPASTAISAKSSSLVLADGILEPANHLDNSRFYDAGDKVFGRLAEDYTVYRMRDHETLPADTLVLGSYWWRIPTGYTLRIAAEVRSHRDQQGAFFSYLAPQFYWLKTTPLRRDADEEATFAPLKDALAHVPGAGASGGGG